VDATAMPLSSCSRETLYQASGPDTKNERTLTVKVVKVKKKYLEY